MIEGRRSSEGCGRDSSIQVLIAVKRLSSKEEPSFFSEAGGTPILSRDVNQVGWLKNIGPA